MSRLLRFLVPLALAIGMAQAALAAADYRAGDQVEVQWKGTWYPAKVLEAKADQWKIRYDGYSSSWDEWVKADRIRKPKGATDAGRVRWKVGDPVRVEWKGKWYPAVILDVDADRYRVHYDGFEDSWDEWVVPARIKRR